MDSIFNDEIRLTEVCLKLVSSYLTQSQLQAVEGLDPKITIWDVLGIELTTQNEELKEIEFTEGLHTYFRVSDLVNVKISGFKDKGYIDLVNQNENFIQNVTIF